MARMRRHHSPEFKLKVVIEVLKGEKTANQIASDLGVHFVALSDWKKQFVEMGPGIFVRGKKEKGASTDKIQAELFEQIGRLKMENEWLKKIGELDLDEKKLLVNLSGELSQRQQCKLLGLCRSGLYYEPCPLTEETL